MRMKEASKAATTKKTLDTRELLGSAMFKFREPVDEIDRAIQAFLTGATEGAHGRYWIHGDMLVYKTAILETHSSLRAVRGIDSKSAKRQELDNVRELIRKVDALEIDLIKPSIDCLRKYSDLLAADAEISYQDALHEVRYRTVKANLIAKRIDPLTYIGNSSVLSLIGRTVSFGRETLNRKETTIQQRLSQLIPMIPFSAFIEAGLDLDKYKLLDRGPAETVTRLRREYDSRKKHNVMVPEDVHFTGASLFSVDGHTYLFDIDRREITEGIFNAFLAEIPVSVATIREAYEALKPAEVILAEKSGLTVLRQGEFFFIPVTGDYSPDRNPNYRPGETAGRWNLEYKRGVLRAGENRPNETSLFHGSEGLVSGTVTHTGREHAPLELKGWYKAVPNTATRSFTLTGDID